jgi:hypothetical protein
MPSTSNGADQPSRFEPGSLYYRGSPEPGQNPSASTEYVSRMTDRIVSVWTDDWPCPIGSGLFIYWHEQLLTAIEPAEIVGRYRERGETSVYEVWEETTSGPRQCRREGLRAGRFRNIIETAVSKACDEFHETTVHQTSDITEAVTPPARLMIALLRIRPFPIANDPIAYLALHAGYRSRGLKTPGPGMVPRAPSSIGIEFNKAIARSLQPKSPSIDSLIRFLAAHSSLIE